MDLEHGGKAFAETGADPPRVAGWRLDQLESALSEADAIERSPALNAAQERVVRALEDIEATVAEIDALLARPPTIFDFTARWGLLLGATVTVLTCVMALRYPGFVAFFAVPSLLLAMHATDEGREAQERMMHRDALPIRLRLAWDKLAEAEQELHTSRDKRSS